MREKTVGTKNSKPGAKITLQTAGGRPDPERRAAFSALRKSMREKPATGYRVGTITADDKYGGDPA